MIIVRTARESDLDGVFELARQAYPGMTTLPPDREVLTAKLRAAVQSLEKPVTQAADETYFLVMEDTDTQSLIGTAAIISSLGSEDEFYSYKLNKVTQSCKELDKKVSFETLNLSNHFEGFAEVATLFLSRDYREHGNGKMLAKSRYLFMAQFRKRFPESVMADLRGYFDEYGRSAFWDAVGRHFFEMGFAEADLYGATHGNQFIADLMPKHPIYVNMLPESAQAVIGRPNVKGKPALEMLKQEGFQWNGHVDIFDAAPSVDTRIDDITTIRESMVAEIAGECNSGDAGNRLALVANDDIHSFAVSRGEIQPGDGNSVSLCPELMAALNTGMGDSIRYVLL